MINYKTILDFIYGNKIVETGPDGIRRGKNPDLLTPDEKRIDKANEEVYYWILQKDNRQYISDLKSEYLHQKGWSDTKQFKSKHVIPQDAFLALPQDIRNDRKKLEKWVKEYHNYLCMS